MKARNDRDAHPETQEGEVLFCYADENSLSLLGKELRGKLRKGTFVPKDHRAQRGVKLESLFPLFIKSSDLNSDSAKLLGIA